MTDYISASFLSKEELSQVKFENNFNQGSNIEKNSLIRRLFQAMILGNTYKRQVKLIFNTSDGYKYTESTVWSKTDNSIMLKGGSSIPINSIYNVEFYG